MKMKKYLFTAIIAALPICAHAQSADTEITDGKRIWTTEFESIDINAPIKVTLKQIDDNSAPCVIYNDHGCEPSAFTAAVDKKGVLKIREKSDGKRTSVTEVEVFYHDLEDIRIARADVLFRDTLARSIADIDICDGAHVRATIDMDDIKLDISGKCVVELAGHARYITAEVSSSSLDASALGCMACRITASHKSDITVDVDERLEAEVSYGAKIGYSGSPSIVRLNISTFGGEIVDNDINTGDISSDAAHE